MSVADQYELAHAQIHGIVAWGGVTEEATERLADALRAVLTLAQSRDHSGTSRSLTTAAVRETILDALGTDQIGDQAWPHP